MAWKAFLERKDWSGEAKLRMARRDPHGGLDVVQPLTFKHYPFGHPVGDDEVVLTTPDLDDINDFLQALVDLAWDFGVRPKRMDEHTSEMKAVRSHLTDMRHIALAKVGLKEAI